MSIFNFPEDALEYEVAEAAEVVVSYDNDIDAEVRGVFATFDLDVNEEPANEVAQVRAMLVDVVNCLMDGDNEGQPSWEQEWEDFGEDYGDVEYI